MNLLQDLVPFLMVLSLCFVAQAQSGNFTRKERQMLSLFNVVKFTNGPCEGTSSNNGTCYTANECANMGGSSSGTCADGFGVCCIFKLSCGDRTSENTTYISQSSSGSVTSPCTYTICPANEDICRIKLDFRTFEILGPQLGTATTIKTATAASTYAGAIGDCLSDTFTVKNPGGVSPPVICGYNTGQHMIVDAMDSNCITVEFVLSGTSSSRQWDIVVNQYTCADSKDLVGDPGSGCLQYHTDGVIGYISSFNWPSTTHTTSTTHLSNQKYTICIRQEQGYCGICYTSTFQSATIFTSATFGLSVSSIADMAAAVTACTADYIIIPQGTAGALNPATATTSLTYCGRFLATTEVKSPDAAGIFAPASVCSSSRPFTVGVKFDEDEFSTKTAASMATLNEMQLRPGGILGFKLQYIQTAC